MLLSIYVKAGLPRDSSSPITIAYGIGGDAAMPAFMSTSLDRLAS
jgi:hypothetical protein